MILWKLLSKNPFRSLQAHMDKTTVCVGKTRDLFDALFTGDEEQVKKLTQEISDVEHECDLIKQEIRTHVSRSVFLPVDRRDILHVLSNMDAIADCAEDIGVMLSLRKMELPAELQPVFYDFLERSHVVVKEARQVIDALDRLFETGFSGPDADAVLKQIAQVEHLEHVADKAQDAFGKALFLHEDNMKPAALWMWTKIANKVGDMANSAERMVGYIRVMLTSN